MSMCGLSAVCRGAVGEAPQQRRNIGGRRRPPWLFLCVLASFHLAKTQNTHHNDKKKLDGPFRNIISPPIARYPMTAFSASLPHILTNMFDMGVFKIGNQAVTEAEV